MWIQSKSELPEKGGQIFAVLRDLRVSPKIVVLYWLKGKEQTVKRGHRMWNPSLRPVGAPSPYQDLYYLDEGWYVTGVSPYTEREVLHIKDFEREVECWMPIPNYR